MREVFVGSVEYVLGENDSTYSEASGFAEIGMPDLPQVWGWGNFRSAISDARTFERAALRACIDRASIDPKLVDFVIRCRATDTSAEPTGHSGDLLIQLGLESAYPIAISANGCDAFLSGVLQATALAATGQASRVLVVCSDVHPTEFPRFQKVGIFSDAACACLVGVAPQEGSYRVTGTARKTDPKNMRPDAGFQSKLAKEMNDDMFLANGFSLPKIRKVFANNLFLPITLTKEQEAGFESEQVFTDNVARIGHCYSADPFINLADFSRQSLINQGDAFLLVSDAPGVRAGLALSAC